MAENQTKLHKLGRTGEKLVKKMVGGKLTRHTAPFDIVDFSSGFAYEVKSMSGFSKDKKIHISNKSMARKVEFAEKYGLEMVLIAVVIYSPREIEVYTGELKQHVRVNQMEKVS